MTLVRNGKPAARIVVAEDTPVNRHAAELLQRFVRESSGAELPLVTKADPRRGDVVIGAGDTSSLTEDGFRLRTSDGVLYISSGGDKGAVYGVVTLLERNLGVDYLAANTYTLDRSRTIQLPEMDCYENPAFRYRQSQAYGMALDPTYRTFLRLEEPATSSPEGSGSTRSTSCSRPRSTAGSTPSTTRSSTASAVRDVPASGV